MVIAGPNPTSQFASVDYLDSSEYNLYINYVIIWLNELIYVLNQCFSSLSTK